MTHQPNLFVMDESVLDHSDSDSGESWTILEPSPLHGDEAPNSKNDSTTPENVAANAEKDEDTDGISIISDSEPESLPPLDVIFDQCMSKKESSRENLTKCPVPDQPPKFNDNCYETMKEEDFLGVNSIKHKTYVHRRNKRLSTVLNIIMLGSVITAAGMAIGHMWGIQDDCAVHSTPSVNKILSNLYKLQEENMFLRNKLKELTLFNNIHNQQKKNEAKKLSLKSKNKKEFEDSLLTKPENYKLANSNLVDNNSENNNFPEIEKLKKIYEENKNWLDDEIAARLTTEHKSVKRLKRSQKIINEKIQNKKVQKLNDNLNRPMETNPDEQKPPNDITSGEMNDAPNAPTEEKKITYADSLKTDHGTLLTLKPADAEKYWQHPKEHLKKKKTKVESKATTESLVSEEETKKDDRYIENKFKVERKKNDRQKQHKKQKRRNKYEQWEMKSGYMKDFDDYSLNSFRENEYILKNTDKNELSRDFERQNYIDQFTETDAKKPFGPKNNPNMVKENDSLEKDSNWFDKRAALRQEARNKLELELFGGTSQNPAGWYFRRMKRREQCRTKGLDNSTYRKQTGKKIYMMKTHNYKTKH